MSALANMRNSSVKREENRKFSTISLLASTSTCLSPTSTVLLSKIETGGLRKGPPGFDQALFFSKYVKWTVNTLFLTAIRYNVRKTCILGNTFVPKLKYKGLREYSLINWILKVSLYLADALSCVDPKNIVYRSFMA